MRDPARIKIMLAKFEIVWEVYPDTRFCQLVSNLTHDYNSGDIFHLEDDKFEKRLDTYIEKLLEEKRNQDSL